MGKSYHWVKALKQPDQTACWSTSMAWWTQATPYVKNLREIDILGMYHNLTGDDGGLKFPDGFKTMLQDTRWGMVTDEFSGASIAMMRNRKDFFDDATTKSPLMCAYWDGSVGGYHAVALYGYKDPDIWAMDPNPGEHVKRDIEYYFQWAPGRKTVLGFRK